MFKRWLVEAFSLVWRKWLVCHGKPMKVVDVTGWRSARVEDCFGGRRHVWICFGIFD